MRTNIDFEKPIFIRSDGATICHLLSGGTYGIAPGTDYALDLQDYLADYPEALVTEPVPEPPSQEELDKREEQSLLAYLSSTDWYVARWGETGAEIPLDIKAKRQEARTRISELRA